MVVLFGAFLLLIPLLLALKHGDRPSGDCLLYEPHSCFKWHCKKFSSPILLQQEQQTDAFVSACTTVKSKIKTEPTPRDAWGMPLEHSEVEAQQDAHQGFLGYMRKAS